MRAIVLSSLLFFLSTCASTSSSPPLADADLLPIYDSAEIYKIGVGDMLTISVWGNPELSLQVPVRPDGYISMPLVGDIAASETEAAILADNISDLLSSQLRNPQVTVIVSQVNSTEYVSRVRITGAVRNPISLPYARGMSVLDAILEAGGVNEVASANRAKLYRMIDGELREMELRLDDILLRGRLETNYSIRPGDVITVPERLF